MPNVYKGKNQSSSYCWITCILVWKHQAVSSWNCQLKILLQQLIVIIFGRHDQYILVTLEILPKPWLWHEENMMLVSGVYFRPKYIWCLILYICLQNQIRYSGTVKLKSYGYFLLYFDSRILMYMYSLQERTQEFWKGISTASKWLLY